VWFLDVFESGKLEKIMRDVIRPREEFKMVRKWPWSCRNFVGFVE